MPPVLQTLLLLVFPVGVIAAAMTDATRYIIPNRLSAALAIAFVPAALAAGLPLTSFALCMAIGVGALAAGVGLFAFRVMGGGDAKLSAACLLWLGPAGIVPFLLWTAVAGGALAVSLLAARRMPGFVTAAGPRWVGRLLEPGGDVPYGVAIAVGALAAFPSSPLARLVHG
ncbi:prepilin peptidase [Caulobacter sp. S45]|uniref:A24 family peptidase n=1 Tax=Caulobacter sp. S45 TaxID=1641861 RepID=UPI0015766D12|nr:prepilin peptidase [Caulobacter sp. S45]